jgi:hypothetical protein
MEAHITKLKMTVFYTPFLLAVVTIYYISANTLLNISFRDSGLIVQVLSRINNWI